MNCKVIHKFTGPTTTTTINYKKLGEYENEIQL